VLVCLVLLKAFSRAIATWSSTNDRKRGLTIIAIIGRLLVGQPQISGPDRDSYLSCYSATEW